VQKQTLGEVKTKTLI